MLASTPESRADMAAAARLVAAVSANDAPGWMQVISEAVDRERLIELTMATAAVAASIASEYFDTDRQAMLDARAFEALEAASPDRMTLGIGF
jgi:hypothetical protein